MALVKKYQQGIILFFRAQIFSLQNITTVTVVRE